MRLKEHRGLLVSFIILFYHKKKLKIGSNNVSQRRHYLLIDVIYQYLLHRYFLKFIQPIWSLSVMKNQFIKNSKIKSTFILDISFQFFWDVFGILFTSLRWMIYWFDICICHKMTTTVILFDIHHLIYIVTDFALFRNLVFFQWVIWDSLYILDNKPLIKCVVCQYFLLFHRLLFFSFAVQKFDTVPHVSFCFCYLCFRYYSQESIYWGLWQEALSLYFLLQVLLFLVLHLSL